MFLTFSMC